MKFEHQWSL